MNNMGNSPLVESSQTGMHHHLEMLVQRHLHAPWLRPCAPHTQAAFAKAHQWVEKKGWPVVLDSGCGVGESTFWLAQQNPRCAVVGVDKSAHRLRRKEDQTLENMLLVRADLVDFWPLVVQASWNVQLHTIYYPNPWPKASQLGRRWHGHPVFAWLARLCDRVELRTNWEIYAREFGRAWEVATGQAGTLAPLLPGLAITPFERKYMASGHSIVRWSS